MADDSHNPHNKLKIRGLITIIEKNNTVQVYNLDRGYKK